MILLEEQGREDSPRVFAIFGLGLIGSSVVFRLQQDHALDSELVPLDWQDTKIQQVQLAQIEEKILSRLWKAASASTTTAAVRLVVLWSAGSAGFRASVAETESELENFRVVLRLVRRIRRRSSQGKITLGLTSSAGGLFEGQRAVNQDSIPTPLRPYGILKRTQETLLSEMGEEFSCRVYRLSSVYGSLGPFRRRGLIPVLIQNGLRQGITRITGTFNTLRDYVWVGDVAAFIASDLRTPHPSGCRFSLLASTKPSSIFEILRLVERVMARPLYVSVAGVASNRADITFAPSCVPPGWRTTDLETTVRRIYLQALASHTGTAGLAA